MHLRSPWAPWTPWTPSPPPGLILYSRFGNLNDILFWALHKITANVVFTLSLLYLVWFGFVKKN